MSAKISKSVVIEPHKRIKNKNVTITTVAKTNKTKMKAKEIKMIGEGLLRKSKPGSKLMIKVLSDKGYFTLKNYSDNIEVILEEIDYVNGREDVGEYTIYKASFYILF